jgi:microcystin-dependent protein
MSQPYVGEIRIVGFTFAPAGWAFCNGAVIPISENDTLFNLIGTTYGGDGQTTFNLPNLQSRFPVHQGTGPSGTSYVIGEMSGVEQVTLNTNQIPAHGHNLAAVSSAGDKKSPAGHALARASGPTPYAITTDGTTLADGAIQQAGASQPHENRPPFLALNFVISLFGIFPSQN